MQCGLGVAVVQKAGHSWHERGQGIVLQEGPTGNRKVGVKNAHNQATLQRSKSSEALKGAGDR